MEQATTALAPFANRRLRFSGVSQLATALGTELIFLELSGTSPIKAENFGIVEIAMFRVCPDGQGQAFTSLVNPDCDFDDMTSKALGLSLKDVINDKPWGSCLAGYFERALADGACLISMHASHWTIPALLRAQAAAGKPAPDSLYSIDIRELMRRLFPDMDTGGTIHHLARGFGVGPYQGVEPCMASVFAQVEILNALIEHFGVHAVADAMAGVSP